MIQLKFDGTMEILVTEDGVTNTIQVPDELVVRMLEDWMNTRLKRALQNMDKEEVVP